MHPPCTDFDDNKARVLILHNQTIVEHSTHTHTYVPSSGGGVSKQSDWLVVHSWQVSVEYGNHCQCWLIIALGIL